MIGAIPIFVPPIGIMANPSALPQFLHIILIILAMFVVPGAIKHILNQHYLWDRFCLRAKKVAMTKSGPMFLTFMALGVIVPYISCLIFFPGLIAVLVFMILVWAGFTPYRKE
jgi:hypothetical protein